MESISGSPKHRASIAATSSISVEAPSDGDTDNAFGTNAVGIQHQHSLDQSVTTSVKQSEQITILDIDEVIAEPLEKILQHKLVKEKCFEMEKKLESLRKKHDKEKLKVSSQSIDGTKKPKFSMTSKLVKRLSSKNL